MKTITHDFNQFTEEHLPYSKQLLRLAPLLKACKVTVTTTKSKMLHPSSENFKASRFVFMSFPARADTSWLQKWNHHFRITPLFVELLVVFVDLLPLRVDVHASLLLPLFLVVAELCHAEFVHEDDACGPEDSGACDIDDTLDGLWTFLDHPVAEGCL
jgi:hypothetical protein